MAYYPLFLDAGTLHALVVGAGNVGLRKIRSLCAAGPASLTVLDPCLKAARKAEIHALGPVLCLERSFVPDDLAGKNLVFAASADRAVNAQVAGACADRGILCNSADAPAEGSFIVPAHFSRGGVTVAVSTGGDSPALARLLRQELEAFVGTRYTRLLEVLARLRPLLLRLNLPTEENSALFRTLAGSALADLLAQGKDEAALILLGDLLPQALHPHLGELLHGN